MYLASEVTADYAYEAQWNPKNSLLFSVTFTSFSSFKSLLETGSFCGAFQCHPPLTVLTTARSCPCCLETALLKPWVRTLHCPDGVDWPLESLGSKGPVCPRFHLILVEEKDAQHLAIRLSIGGGQGPYLLQALQSILHGAGAQ